MLPFVEFQFKWKRQKNLKNKKENNTEKCHGSGR
jgi:hypothetical protein